MFDLKTFQRESKKKKLIRDENNIYLTVDVFIEKINEAIEMVYNRWSNNINKLKNRKSYGEFD